jgi:hypothetical protein
VKIKKRKDKHARPTDEEEGTFVDDKMTRKIMMVAKEQQREVDQETKAKASPWATQAPAAKFSIGDEEEEEEEDAFGEEEFDDDLVRRNGEYIEEVCWRNQEAFAFTIVAPQFTHRLKYQRRMSLHCRASCLLHDLNAEH